MNTSIFIGISLLILTTIPFVMISRKQKIRKRKKIESLRLFAQEYNATLFQTEMWGNYALGLDNFNDQLFYIGRSDEKIIVDLSTIKYCEVNKITESSDPEGVNLYTTGVELIFYGRKSDPVILPFYDSVYDSPQMNFEIQLAKKWENIINTDIKTIA